MGRAFDQPFQELVFNNPAGVTVTSDLYVNGTVALLQGTVTATTTSGKELPAEALEKVTTACEQTLALDEARLQLLGYIESRMNILAPNLTVVVGSKVAAQMMSMAGGLQELSRMPACNIQMMGAKRKVSNGMSTAALGIRAGVIAQVRLCLGCRV